MKYKIAVYAICKNEEKFVDRWFDSAKEADGIFVLDTGSTDKTIEKFENKKVKIKQKIIKPWNFAVAKNKALEMIPKNYDYCICLDLDEVLDKGWREKLEEIIDKIKFDSGMINCNWSFDEAGNPLVTYFMKRIHTRKNFKWKYAIHEVVEYIGRGIENNIELKEINISHYPDVNKSRSQYLELLIREQLENPNDERLMHYLGREYMYNSMWNECIEILKKHIEYSNWKDEKATSMRFIAKAYMNLNDYENAIKYFEMAILEVPNTREAYVEYAILEYGKENWNKVKELLEQALSIKSRNVGYINEGFCWDSTISDYLSIAFYNLGNYEEALKYVEEALKLDPNDERIKNNKEIIQKKLENNE